MAILSKILTPEDCKARFSVPREFHHLINGRCGVTELSVRDADSNKMYKFVLAVRKNPPWKPVFQAKGWRDFVRSRHLQAGDLIFFAGDEKNAGGFKIRAHRAFDVTEPLSTRLTTTDCISAFSVPTEFHALINGGRPSGAELSVRDVQTNQVYNFVFEVHREWNYPEAVFQADGWLDFVRRRRLVAGDEIYFSTDETNAGGFKILPLFDSLGRADRAATCTTQ